VSLVKGVKADTRFQFELGQLFRDGSDYLNTLGFVKRRSVNYKSKVSEPCHYFVLIPSYPFLSKRGGDADTLDDIRTRDCLSKYFFQKSNQQEERDEE